MGLGDRINEIRKDRKMSIDELCVRSGVPKGTLSKITAGITTNPTLDTVQAIAKALECRLDDFDDTPRFTKENAPSDISEEAKKIAKEYDKLSEHGKGAVKAILSYEGEAAKPNPDTKAPKVIQLPKGMHRRGPMTEVDVYDEPSAAGLGNYVDAVVPRHMEQYPSDMVPSRTDFGVLISGNSMEPKIPDGSTVFVQAAPALDSGEIGIFVLDGQTYCKQLKIDHEHQRTVLHSINPEYTDIEIPPWAEFRTLGRVLDWFTPRKFD